MNMGMIYPISGGTRLKAIPKVTREIEPMQSTLNREELRRFYDRFGRKQDKQGFYEDRALAALIRNSAFADAGSVFEIGCGTGRLAAQLLSDHLPSSARYVGIDLSATMVDLASQCLAPWTGRADVHQTTGDFDFSSYGGPFERIVSTYVFDLLSPADIDAALAGAHAVAAKGGLLCVAGVTEGVGLLSRATSSVWELVHKLKPSIVGGCRPIVLTDFIAERHWRIVHREVVVAATVPSEVIIAEAL